MTKLLGGLAALTIVYIAVSLIAVNKVPSRAVGFLALITVGPVVLVALAHAQGFAAGFLLVVAFFALVMIGLRLLLGKKLFGLLLALPLIKVAKDWFDRSERNLLKEVWSAGRKSK